MVERLKRGKFQYQKDLRNININNNFQNGFWDPFWEFIQFDRRLFILGIYIFLFILLFIFGMLLMGNAMDGGYDDQYYFRKVMLGTAFISISFLGGFGILIFLILH